MTGLVVGGLQVNATNSGTMPNGMTVMHQPNTVSSTMALSGLVIQQPQHMKMAGHHPATVSQILPTKVLFFFLSPCIFFEISLLAPTPILKKLIWCLLLMLFFTYSSINLIFILFFIALDLHSMSSFFIIVSIFVWINS